MPVNKKYTHIFFDLDNTLWDFEKNSFQAMLTTYNHFEIQKLVVLMKDELEKIKEQILNIL